MLAEAESFLKTVVLGVGIRDFSIPLGFLVWLIVLSLPIEDLDCQDAMTGTLYAAFVGTCGLGLVLGVPQLYSRTEDIVSMVVCSIAFYGIPASRWVRVAIRQNTLDTEVKRKEEQQQNSNNMEL